ncbi:unnamed protein product [Moneuplotes crassus]|uniref:Uncharacterized protein n=1 Tax=Euplotes crassus TaxID=5936 RepID=A0AAD1Y106_EUPCR|nr:unnamed protein product [Moneuplotes crassus]
MIKIILLLLISTALADPYKGYWGVGNNLLDEIQSGKEQILVITFINPHHSPEYPDRLALNSQVESELDDFIIVKHNNNPMKIRHAVVDITDQRNRHLLDKLDFRTRYTNEGPIVYVSSMGNGIFNWGPTTAERVEDVIKDLQKDAQEKSNSSR